jgi:hypothetical protein
VLFFYFVPDTRRDTKHNTINNITLVYSRKIEGSISEDIISSTVYQKVTANEDADTGQVNRHGCNADKNCFSTILCMLYT